MDFKIQPSVHPYQVNTANETTDDERRRQKQQSTKARADKKMTPAQAEENTPATTETKVENSEPISSQIVDSKTTLELLAHRPVNSKSLHERLKKLAKSSTKEKLVSDVKHLNKAL